MLLIRVRIEFILYTYTPISNYMIYITESHTSDSKVPDPKATSVKPRGGRKRAVDSGKDRIHAPYTYTPISNYTCN